MSIILGIITFLYIFLLLFLLLGFKKLPVFSGERIPKTSFSVIVPFRDEANYLQQLFNSLSGLNYPQELFEVIMINDGSKDASEEICRNFAVTNRELNLKLLQNSSFSGSPKKDAITTGVRAAANEYVITTDADCLVPENWLSAFNAKIMESGAKILAGPVIPIWKNGFWNHFQELDFFSLQTATMGGFGVDIPFMCNGANLCYSKKAFEELNGFEGNTDIASGDDIFLLEKFRNKGLKTDFLKSQSAVVTTALQPDLKSLISQRIRWAAKTSAYNSIFGRIVGLAVLLMNLGLVIAFIGFAAGLFSPSLLLIPFMVKFNMDFILIYQGAQFFDREKALKNYFLCSVIYPFFVSYVAILSLFSGYHWKGRRFKK